MQDSDLGVDAEGAPVAASEAATGWGCQRDMAGHRPAFASGRAAAARRARARGRRVATSLDWRHLR